MIVTHHDCEDQGSQTLHELQMPQCSCQNLMDRAICQAIRECLMATNNLQQDELDLDFDGVVTITARMIIVEWVGSRGARSVTTLIW